MAIIPDNTININTPAKINLALDVTGQRNDGYHTLEMVMQTISVYDSITVSAAISNGIHNPVNLTMNKELPDKIPASKNLVYKAAMLMKEKFNIKTCFNIHLDKNIPAAAGLAGGSSDCAATLEGINKLCHLRLTEEELCQIGVTLGADVPFCIKKGTVLCEGIGEILTPLSPLPEIWLVLVKPCISVSTAYVYTHLDLNGLKHHPNINGMVNAINAKDIKKIASCLSNVLETVTIQEYPLIREIKTFLTDNGAAGSLMSGSGPTVFGMFEDKETADAVYKRQQENIIMLILYYATQYNKCICSLCHASCSTNSSCINTAKSGHLCARFNCLKLFIIFIYTHHQVHQPYLP